MLLKNRFTFFKNSSFDRIFILLWHSESSSAVTLLFHADWVMLKNASNQGGAKSVTVAPGKTKSRPWMLVASKVAFLENYLAASTWILNGSSIERHEKKHQPFSLSSIWKPGASNFWVKICLALEESIFQVEWLIATLIIQGSKM